MKKPIIVLGLLFFIILALAVARVVVSNSLSTTGIDLSKTQDEIDRYKHENALLQEKILETASLTHIKDEAEKMGYIDTSDDKHNMYISSPLPIALKP